MLPGGPATVPPGMPVGGTVKVAAPTSPMVRPVAKSAGYLLQPGIVPGGSVSAPPGTQLLSPRTVMVMSPPSTKLHVGSPPAPPPLATHPPDLFSRIDANKDGVIDRIEMDTALRGGVVQEGPSRPQVSQGPSVLAYATPSYAVPSSVVPLMEAQPMNLDQALSDFLQREGLPRDLVRLGENNYLYGGERLEVFLSERSGRAPTLKVRSPLYNNGQAVDIRKFASLFENDFKRPRSPSPSPQRPRTMVTVPTTTPEVYRGVSSPSAERRPSIPPTPVELMAQGPPSSTLLALHRHPRW